VAVPHVRSRLAALLRRWARAADRTARRLDARTGPEPVIPPGAPEHWLREVERRAPQLLRGGGLRAGGGSPGRGGAPGPAHPAATPPARPTRTRRDFGEFAASGGPRARNVGPVAGGSPEPDPAPSARPAKTVPEPPSRGRTVRPVEPAPPQPSPVPATPVPSPELRFPAPNLPSPSLEPPFAARALPSPSPMLVASPGGRPADPPAVPETTMPVRSAVVFPDAPVAARTAGQRPEVPEKSWPALPDDGPLWTVPAGAWTAERIRMLDAEQAGG